MKKKLLAFTCIAAMTMGLLVGCGSSDSDKSDNSSENTTNEVASNLNLLNDGVLNVGVEIGYPPFEDFADDGSTPIGYDIDIIYEVADRLGLEVNFVNTAWDGIFAGIGVNYDCVCSAVTITEERKETMIFSTPYINNYQSVVVLADSDLAVNGFTDLDGKVIAVQKETTSDILMSDYKSTGSIDVVIVANEKVTSCFTQLENGEIDAVVVDSTVADGYLQRSDKYKLAYVDKNEAEQFGIAMAMNNVELQKAINEVLAQMEADGFIQETYDYWFGAGDK